MPEPPGLRLAVVGKGGAGKSVVAATVARLLARRGREVLVLDSDTLPGVTLSLGASVPDQPPLGAAAERDEHGRWRMRRGVGPYRAIRRYATVGPDGVRLLQSGKQTPTGMAPVMGSVNAFYQVVHRLHEPAALRAWAIVGDLSAGPRQTAFGWAPYAERFLAVVEPTWPSMLTARRIVRIGTARRPAAVHLVANKVRVAEDVARIESALGAPVLAAVPADDGVREAERRGVALLDHAPASPAVRALDGLVEALEGSSLGSP